MSSIRSAAVMFTLAFIGITTIGAETARAQNGNLARQIVGSLWQTGYYNSGYGGYRNPYYWNGNYSRNYNPYRAYSPYRTGKNYKNNYSGYYNRYPYYNSSRNHPWAWYY